MACMVPGNSIHYVQCSPHLGMWKLKLTLVLSLSESQLEEENLGLEPGSSTFSRSPITFPQGDVRDIPPLLSGVSFLNVYILFFLD